MKQINLVLSLFLFMLAHTINAQGSSIPSNQPLPAHRHVVIQLGGYSSSGGLSQNISIEELVGNQYNLDQHHPKNGLIGLGYFIDGPDNAYVHALCVA